jgi:hypothetical protein
VIGDAFQDLAQVGLGVQAVELGGFQQRVHGRGTLAAGVGAGEQKILARQNRPSQSPLGGIVVDLDGAVVDVMRQGIPALQRVIDRSGRLGFGRYRGQAGDEPVVQLL